MYLHVFVKVAQRFQKFLTAEHDRGELQCRRNYMNEFSVLSVADSGIGQAKVAEAHPL